MAALPLTAWLTRAAAWTAPKLLTAGGITAGVTTGIGAAIKNNDDIAEALGQTAEQQADNRLSRYDRTKGEDGKLKSTLLEKAWDNVLDRDVKSEVKELDDARIRQAVDDNYDIDGIRQKLGEFGYSSQQIDEYLTLGDQQTKGNYNRKVGEAQNLVNIGRKLSASDIDVASLPDKTIGGLEKAYANREGGPLDTKRTAEARTAKLDAKEARRYADRQDLLLAQMQANNQQNANNFQLQLAQQQYQNRALDMRDAADQRKDKMMIIAQIMKGLESSSRAFTY